ncbi:MULTISPECIES: cytochrome c oxidase subunit 4 [Amycolatopsis]|uniref:Cytochrome c oxidase polypeptide 4 n=4 Tax=Amycolatopsis TaxID=1813 RepID=A0A076N259_AMYME|nr:MULTISPECIES: cytochrome c oxidase subunit 4 [Amycolatopsis]AIJ25221.1 integral membrane protein [Amycolatopsis methanolica 239]MCF6425844.1 cytochrome c oxidase subunit 4 [Amycolatopsis tucumanensis]ROS42881.1 cytochrome c oxidase subunit IV [Amycolatopsis thermoflava]GHF07127.1 cytochrome c oxidase polypeptide 4 [Amycolatopsis deserti]
MKVEARIFDLVTAFAFFIAIVYGVWTGLASGYGVEPVGLVALILTGGLSLLAGSYMRFVGRRIEPRPEDRDDAEISDGAGEMGFFSPGSYWPIGLAASAAFVGLGLAFFHIWMLVVGGILILLTVGGLVFEYHTGPNHE